MALPPPINALIAGNHAVYVRANWASPWVADPFLHCDAAVWAAAPSISTATIRHYYGWIAPAGTHTFREILKRSGYERLYIKIEFNLRQTTELGWPTWETKSWYGVIECTADHHDGAVLDPVTLQDVATGDQTFTCYGIEHLLDRELVYRSRIDQDGAGAIVAIERACVFNRDGKPNRSAASFGGSYHFCNIAGDEAFWTTRDIVEYLLRYHSPTDATGAVNVPFALSTLNANVVANWDQPVVEAEGRSVYSLLTSLLPRQRLTGFHFFTVAPTTYLQPWTFTGAAINTKPGGGSIPANTPAWTVVFDRDQSADGMVKVSTVEQYDQVIVRGARRRTVFTVSDSDATLSAGWSVFPDSAAYDLGASATPGYAALNVDDRRRRNEEARAQPTLAKVYRRFQITEPWDGLAGDGIGGAKTFPFREPNPTTGLPQQVPHFDRELAIEQTMPLLAGVDYSGNKLAAGTVVVPPGAASEMPPLVLWMNPVTGDYVPIERQAGAGPLIDPKDQLDWSASVEVPDADRAVLLTVSGAPQHVLAFDEFAPLPDDEDQGQHRWQDAIVTLSVREDRYAEVRWPSDAALAATLARDYARRLLLDAGDYRADYVCPNTVVGVDASGAPARSDGGFITDDTPELLAIARVAFAFYSRIRRVLQFSSEQLSNTLDLGDFVAFVSQPDADLVGTHYTAIGTPVTEIRIETPDGTTEAMPGPPRMSWTTDAGELDAVGLFSYSKRRK